MTHRLRIDPNICPCCRSVQTRVITVNHKTRHCECRSCQKQYVQHFNSDDFNGSPYKAVGIDGRVVWSEVPPKNPYQN